MNESLVKGRLYQLEDHEITWAGDCPWTGSFCVGTESGEVLFYEDSGLGRSLALSEKIAEDAINGAAFFGDFMGISTRSEIILCRRSPGVKFGIIVREQGGAHGILATPGGQFLAPMGTAGLFCIDVSEDQTPRAWIDHANGVQHNYYSLRYLSAFQGRAILVCAARNDGLLTIQFDKHTVDDKITGLTAPNIDVIDVCSLGSPQWPCAVAALCHDRTLIFVRNVLAFEPPQTLRFDGFQGTPYSILSAQGHVFVLTSREIIVLPHLGTRYLSGEQLDRPIQYRHKATAAVDAFIHDAKELMIITDDGIDFFDISKLVNGSPETAGVHEPPDVLMWDELFEAPSLVTTPWNGLVA
jgi:hypothetical protein